MPGQVHQECRLRRLVKVSADLVDEALGRLLARVAAQAQVRAVHQALADRQLRRVDVILLHVAADAREALLLLRKTLRASTSAASQALSLHFKKMPTACCCHRGQGVGLGQ